MQVPDDELLLRVLDALEALPGGASIDVGALARELAAPESVVRRCALAAGALERIDPVLPPRVGDWIRLEELARGGQGSVHRVRHARRDEEGALKLLQQLAPRQRARLEREVRALVRLRHPHVVRVLDAGETSGCPWLVMELVPGESLQERLNAAGPLAVADAVDLVEQVADGVAHAHAQGLLHRDLKPGNVLLRPDGRAVVTDFGLARELDGSWSHTSLSQSGRFLGTPGYCAPEQASGDLERVSPASDVYGLGALLFALLTGQPPDRPGDGPARLRPQVDAALDAVCRRALATDPARRPAGAAQLAAELARWRAGRGSSATGRRLLAGAGLMAAALVLAGVGVVLREPGLPPAPPRAPAPLPASEPLAEVTRVDSAVERVSAAGSEVEDAEERELELAFLELRRGELEPALARLDALLTRHPDHGRALCLRGELRLERGDHDGARADLNRALAIEAPDVRLLCRRSSLLWQLGDLRTAEAELQRAATLEPTSAEVLWRLGGLQSLSGRVEEAALTLDRAVAADPGSGECRLTRADLRLARGDREGAREDLEDALGLLDPERREQAWVQAVRGRLPAEPSYGVDERLQLTARALRRGDLSRARALLEGLPPDAALEPPTRARRYLLTAVLCESAGAREACARAAREASAGPLPAAELALAEGLLAISEEQTDRALEAFARRPALPEALVLAGLLRSTRLELDAAQAAYEEAVSLAPDYARAHGSLGHVHRLARRLEDALHEIDLALIAAPRRALLWQLRAYVHADRGEFRASLQDVQRGLRVCEPDGKQAAELRVMQTKARRALGVR